MSEHVTRQWVIVREPGCVPETKRPIGTLHSDALTLLRELVACRPENATLTLARLTSDGELWVSCGREELTISAHQ